MDAEIVEPPEHRHTTAPPCALRLSSPGRAAVTAAAAPYDLLNDAWGWPSVFASVQQRSASALAARRTEAEGGPQSPGAPDPARRLTRPEAEALGREVLTAVVADVLEPHRLATLLGLHAEAVSHRLLPPVPGAAELDHDLTLVEARHASTPALLGVEAGIYGIIGDVVRAQVGA